MHDTASDILTLIFGRAIAVFNADNAKDELMCDPAAYPMIRLEKMSLTAQK